VKSNNSNNISNNNIVNSNTKLPRGKGIIPISTKQKNKTSRTQLISTGENTKINIFDITPSNNNEKAFSFKVEKYNNEKNADTLDIKFGNIRFNLYSKYISNCLNIFSEYKEILKQPIIKSIKKLENDIIIQKELLKIKKYILNYISHLPEEKKNIQVKEYYKYLQKEIEHDIKLGIESDIYEINYLFNFFPKGIEISFDYEVFELIYYNSKKNNKISGKALLPSPEFYFKLDFNKVDLKLFDFEIELEDLDDFKYILLQMVKILKDKIKIAKLFIEPCLSDIRFNLEQKEKQKERDSAKLKSKKKNKIDIIENIKNMKFIKNKNDGNKNTVNDEIKKNNYSSINDINSNIKENDDNEDIKPSLSFDGNDKEIKKIKINNMKNILNNSNEEEKINENKSEENNKEEKAK